MSGLFEQPDNAATPLTPEETRGLIPAYIADRRDLDQAEQENIARRNVSALGIRIWVNYVFDDALSPIQDCLSCITAS